MLAFACAALVSAASSAAAQARSDLVIAATTDVHGRLRAWDYYANAADPARTLAGAATIVDSIRRVHPERTLLVDAGDLLQGNPLLYVAARVRKQPVHPVAATMNVMRYDAAVIGNHEFNYGVPLLREVIGKAAFPFLAANVVDSTGRFFTAPYTIVTRGGIRIGIIGATTPGSMVWDRDNMRAAGLTVTDIVPAVRRAVADAKRARADVIVVLLHSGLSGPASYDTVSTGLPSENVAARVPREIDGIDVVVYGHSHREMVDTTINGALLIQPRNWAASVGVATLTMERQGRTWRVVSRRGSSVAVAGHAESPQVLAASVSTHGAAVAWATESVGRTAVAWTGDSARVADMPITDLITEIMRRETGADLAATAAFSLDASLPAGQITRAQLARLYPYDNTLRAVRVSGAAVRAFLEHSARYYRGLDASGGVPAAGIVDNAVPGYNFDVISGADYTIDLRRPLGQRITRLEFRGRSVQPTDSFTLAVNNYRQGGGGGFAMLAGAPVVYEKDVDIRQLVIDEVARVGQLDPRQYAARNWRLEPAAAVAAAYAEQNRGRAREAGGSAPAGGAAPRPPQTAGAPASTGPVQAPAVQGRRVRVIAMSDFHAALTARPDGSGRMQGGAVALSAAIRRAQAECTGDCVSVVVDAGDLFTGSPASDWDAGRPTVATVNQLDIAAGAIGNHEFDFGQDTLRTRLRELRHAMLGVNVRGADGRIPSWLRPDTIVQRGSVKIGIVGAAGTHTSTSTKKRNVSSLRFLDPAPLISERVRALRAAGAQVVVGVIHDGVRCERDRPQDCRGGGLDVARALTDRPDVFVMGHAHVNATIAVGTMPVVEPSSSGRAIIVVDVPLEGGQARAEVRPVYGDSTAGANPRVDSIARASLAQVRSRLEQPVATIAEALPRRGAQYGLGNLIADAARSNGGGEMAAWNNGGIRADVREGPLQFGAVHEVSPFGNLLVRVRLRGRDVRRVAESWVQGAAPDVHISGMVVEYDRSKAAGSRVVRVTDGKGAVLADDRIYTLIINDYMIDDAEAMTAMRAVSTEILNIRDTDSLAGYLRKLPQPVRGPTEPRFRDVSEGASR